LKSNSDRDELSDERATDSEIKSGATNTPRQVGDELSDERATDFEIKSGATSTPQQKPNLLALSLSIIEDPIRRAS